MGTPIALTVEMHRRQKFFSAHTTLRLRCPGKPKGEGDVLGGREPREQCRLLKHEPDPSFGMHHARSWRIQTGEKIQQR